MARRGYALSDIAIRRPVTTIVASLLIVTAGLAALQSIPIRELPDVDRSVVTITTGYQGASPQVIDTDITEVIESAISGVAGVESQFTKPARKKSHRGGVSIRVVISMRPPMMFEMLLAEPAALCRRMSMSRSF